MAFYCIMDWLRAKWVMHHIEPDIDLIDTMIWFKKMLAAALKIPEEYLEKWRSTRF